MRNIFMDYSETTWTNHHIRRRRIVQVVGHLVMIITMTAMQIGSSNSHMPNRIQLNHKQLLQALLVVTSILMQPMEGIRIMLPYGIPVFKPNKDSSKHNKIKAHQVSRGLQARDDHTRTISSTGLDAFCRYRTCEKMSPYLNVIGDDDRMMCFGHSREK